MIMAENGTNIPHMFIIGTYFLNDHPLAGHHLSKFIRVEKEQVAYMSIPTKYLAGVAALAIGLLSACAPATQTARTSAPAVPAAGILLFGDSGYLLSYPDKGDYTKVLTQEQYLENERASWLKDKRPPEEYEPRPFAVSPETGGVMAASGLQAVSTAITNFCLEQEPCDFGLMLGDNVYPNGLSFGADGFDDASRMRDLYTLPFGRLVEEQDSYVTYVTLGNHDWKTSRASGMAQIDFFRNAKGYYIDGPFYSVKPPAGKGEIELFIVDTSMLLSTVTVFQDSLNDDGSEVVSDEVEVPDWFVEPLTDAERGMATWLEQALKASTARWKIVVAHHPIWSSSGSKFEQARALRQLILPAMCRYADAYIVGHDHTLEVHTDDCRETLGKSDVEPLVQIVSGAASKQRPVNTKFMRQQDLKYPEHKTLFAKGLVWGFAYLDINGDEAKVTILSVPDDGSSDISVEYEYRFARRSTVH